MNEQFPVDTQKITCLRFLVLEAGVDVFRVVVTNNQTTTHCQPRQEYYHGGLELSLEGVTEFTLLSEAIEGTQEAVESFVDSMPLRLTTAQDAVWSRGVYVPVAPQRRLYKAPDPNDNTKMIGVLIECDPENDAAQVTWYKTSDASTLFPETPPSIKFELVVDAQGAPSLDPDDIGGWTWYFSTSATG